MGLVVVVVVWGGEGINIGRFIHTSISLQGVIFWKRTADVYLLFPITISTELLFFSGRVTAHLNRVKE
jgi:hypothetical protein